MKKIMILTILAILISSCRNGKEGLLNEETRIKNTVLLYNSLLAKGYREQNMTFLKEAATEKRASKAYYHMAALGESFVKMDAKPKEIKFTDVVIRSGDMAEAETREKWDYKYINFNTGNEIYDNSIDYINRYKLFKVSDRWLVDDIDVISSREKKSEKFSPLEGLRSSDDSPVGQNNIK